MEQIVSPPKCGARQEPISTTANPLLKTDLLFEGKLCGAPDCEYRCLSCHRGNIHKIEKETFRISERALNP